MKVKVMISLSQIIFSDFFASNFLPFSLLGQTLSIWIGYVSKNKIIWGQFFMGFVFRVWKLCGQLWLICFNELAIYHSAINFITFKMIQDNQTRKSKRAHVTNPMYSEGIDELRKDAEIRYRKKCRNSPHHLPQDKKNSFSAQQGISDIDIEGQQDEDHDQHILCILPNERMLKLQIIVSKGPATPKMEPLREEKPARKHSTDLLSIFQQVIKQAGYDCSPNGNEKIETVKKVEQKVSEQQVDANKENEERQVKQDKNIENEISKALAPENEEELNNAGVCKKGIDEKVELQSPKRVSQDENQGKTKKSYEILERQEINLTQN